MARPHPLFLALLCQVWAGAKDTGEGEAWGLPSQASLPPGGSRMRQAKGMPRKSPGPELQGAGAQPPLLCSCLLPQGPSSPSVKVRCQPGDSAFVNSGPGPPLVLAKCAVALALGALQPQASLASCPTPPPHTPLQPTNCHTLRLQGFQELGPASRLTTSPDPVLGS